MGYFVPNQTISEAHGTLIEGGEWPIMPIFHPAAALYNGNMRQVLYEDFSKLKQVLDKLERK
jgi:uracil-DNA glycosylase